jgi:hypothetical protein
MALSASKSKINLISECGHQSRFMPEREGVLRSDRKVSQADIEDAIDASDTKKNVASVLVHHRTNSGIFVPTRCGRQLSTRAAGAKPPTLKYTSSFAGSFQRRLRPKALGWFGAKPF